MDAREFAGIVWQRLMELVLAPVDNPAMVWAVVPLAAVIVFMTLYFARHRSEELGWNTAFGNTAAFLFMAVNLVREMYYSRAPPSWDNVTSNAFYLTFTLALAGTGAFLMFVTYFHLLPKRLAFALFSPAPINVALYVMMAIVYAGVPADYATAAAGAVLMLAIATAAKIIQVVLAAFIEDENELGKREKERRKALEKFREAEYDEFIEEAPAVKEEPSGGLPPAGTGPGRPPARSAARTSGRAPPFQR